MTGLGPGSRTRLVISRRFWRPARGERAGLSAIGLVSLTLASCRVAPIPCAITAPTHGTASLVLRPGQLRGEYLTPQRPLDQIHGACGLDQPAALGAVGRQHRLHAAGRQLVAELGPGGPGSPARALPPRRPGG